MPWVLPIRFEEMRTNPESIANRAVDYILKRTLDHHGFPPLVIGDDYKAAIHRSIDQMGTTKHSGSFRAGRVGDWRDEFTPELLEAFDRVGGNEWIERLGYEQEKTIA